MSLHTCTPHRCWPSRVGWGLAMFLAAYVLFLHSFWFAERQEWERQVEGVNQKIAQQQHFNETNLAKEIAVALRTLEKEEQKKRWRW